MPCSVCSFLKKFATNWLLLLDMAINTLLLGSPKETVSARLGRAEKLGNKFAHTACKVIGWFSNPKHCEWAADPATGTMATEFWDWSPSSK